MAFIWGGDFKEVLQLLRSKKLGKKDIRFFPWIQRLV
jgi:hypothetical protein